MGGLFALLERFAKASRSVASTASPVVGQRLHLACVSESAEPFVDAGGIDAAELSHRATAPLFRPRKRLVREERVVEASHEGVVQRHSNEAVRSLWGGDVLGYTRDLRRHPRELYEGRRVGRRIRLSRSARNKMERPSTGATHEGEGGRSVRWRRGLGGVH